MMNDYKPRGRPRLTHPNIRSIYITQDDLEGWEKFKEAMREDGTSASAQIMTWIYEWFEKHPTKKERNPQTALSRFPTNEVVTEKLHDPTESKPKPLPDFSSMTDEHLLERYYSPFTDIFDKNLIVMVLRDKRGFNIEDLRRDKRMGRPQ
jgi:hypothetical protein